MLIINADDWGRSESETDATLECVAAGRVTSVTAMVFMSDSERAATLAAKAGVPVGLHLNLCERLSCDTVTERVLESQLKIVRFMKSHKLSSLLYHPGLRDAFMRAYEDQAVEFRRLYGRAPTHVDGHRHKHLATNVLIDKVIPVGEKVRRGFFFWPGEKSIPNRAYRRLVDWYLTKRYRTTDYFFALSQCLEVRRLEMVLALAKSSSVEIMCHPALKSERSLLLSDEFGRRLAGITLGSYEQIG